MRCPDCGGDVEKVRQEDGGCIEETVIGRHMQLHRKVRPASFYACTGCEWCSEQAPPEPERPPARCWFCGVEGAEPLEDDGEPWACGDCLDKGEDPHERAAARARARDFEDTGGKDWT